MCTVSEFEGNEEAELRPDAHELQAFSPTADHTLKGEAGGFATTVAAVEHGAVSETTFIVAAHRVSGHGFHAESGRQHLILQPRCSDRHSFALGIFGEELFAGFAGGLAGSFLLFAQEILHKTLGLHFGHFGFLPVEHLFDGARELSGQQSFDVHPFEVVADDQAEGIREFFHILRSKLSFFLLIFSAQRYKFIVCRAD